MPLMRRIQAIFVVIALLAAPLAVLARGTAASSPEACGRLCCLWGARHAHQSETPAGRATCHHRSLPRSDCAMKALCDHSLAFSFVSPLPPTVMEAAALLHSLLRTPSALISSPITSLAGFLPAPFEPPRS